MIEHSSEVKDLFTALHLAQAEMPPVPKDAKNPHFKNKYATLENVIQTARPYLVKNGISVTQAPGAIIDGSVEITTMVMHTSGQWIRSTLHVPITKRDPQGVGSAITYGCRYSLMAALNLAPTDDDGEAARIDNTDVVQFPSDPAIRRSSNQIKRDQPGRWAEIETALRNCVSEEALRAYSSKIANEVAGWPETWRDALIDVYEGRKSELRARAG